MDRVCDPTSVKAVPILADQPRLTLGSADLQGLIKFLAEGDGRITGITEKFRALHAYNFGFRVSKNLLRTRVPNADCSVAVQVENSAVADVLDQKPQTFFPETQAFPECALFGAVPHHFRIASEFSRGITQRREHAAAPEPGPVLPHMPAFVFRPALAQSGRCLLVRCASRNIFWREEYCSGLAQNLLLRIAEQQLCALTPTDNALIQTESDEGEIASTVRKSAEFGLEGASSFELNRNVFVFRYCMQGGIALRSGTSV